MHSIVVEENSRTCSSYLPRIRTAPIADCHISRRHNHLFTFDHQKRAWAQSSLPLKLETHNRISRSNIALHSMLRFVLVLAAFGVASCRFELATEPPPEEVRGEKLWRSDKMAEDKTVRRKAMASDNIASKPRKLEEDDEYYLDDYYYYYYEDPWYRFDNDEFDDDFEDDFYYGYNMSIATRASKCHFTHKSSNVGFDLRPLMINGFTDESYEYKGEDSQYDYVWNICGTVTQASKPEACMHKHGGSVYQYLDADKDNKDGFCEVVARFLYPEDRHFDLIDDSDPARGVSISYDLGDFCHGMTERDAVIDIYCENVEAEIRTVSEPQTCSYHMVMASYYGCPTSCPVTSNGLCDSSGQCKYDSTTKKAKCKCFKGTHGDDCSLTHASQVTDDDDFEGNAEYKSKHVSFGQALFSIFFVCILIASFAIGGNMYYKRYYNRRGMFEGYASIPQNVPDGEPYDERGLQIKQVHV